MSTSSVNTSLVHLREDLVSIVRINYLLFEPANVRLLLFPVL